VRNVTTHRPISLRFPGRSNTTDTNATETTETPTNSSVTGANSSTASSTGVETKPETQAEAGTEPETTSDAPMRVDRLDVTVTNDSDFTMNVTTATDPLSTTPAFERTDGTESLAHMRVNHSVSDADIENVSFTFRLSKARLQEMETEPPNVALYRYHDGEWTELPTTVRTETADEVIFEAFSPGLSEFAAGAKRATFELDGAAVDVEKIDQGDTIDVYVTVTNLGGADGRFHADLVLNDIVVDDRDVSVAAGGQRRITFEQALDRAGTYEVRVNGLLAGEVAVEQSEASRHREASREGPSQTSVSSTRSPFERSGIGTAPVVVGGLLVAVSILAAIRLRRNRRN
jgi:PGF-pre-PGF domain-containing protein